MWHTLAHAYDTAHADTQSLSRCTVQRRSNKDPPPPPPPLHGTPTRRVQYTGLDTPNARAVHYMGLFCLPAHVYRSTLITVPRSDVWAGGPCRTKARLRT